MRSSRARSARRARVTTASGVTNAYQITLNSVDVGGIRVDRVLATVIEGSFPEMPLLGTTYLQHVEMHEKDGILLLMRKFCIKYSQSHPDHEQVRSVMTRIRSREEFEQVIEEQPNLAGARSDLAYLLATDPASQDRALELAEAAAGAARQDPNIARVAGYVYLQTGRPEAAMSPVQKLLYIGSRAMGALEFRPPLRERHPEAAQALAERVRGHRCFKLKLGGREPASDWLRVSALRDALGPDAVIRLDHVARAREQ